MSNHYKVMGRTDRDTKEHGIYYNSGLLDDPERVLFIGKLLTPDQYKELRERHNRFEQWRNGRTSYQSGSVPLDIRLSNDELSALEVYDFVYNPPQRYFLYIKETDVWNGFAQTWTGDQLGRVQFGHAYRSAFGDVRVPVTIEAINGRTYYGTYYKSAGDYARIRIKKGKR